MTANNNSNKMLVLQSQEQVIIFKTVLLPEIQTGNWAKARPHGHADVFDGCEITASKAKTKQGCYGFVPQVRYFFAHGKLMNPKMEEISKYVNFFMVAPDYPLEHKRDALMITPEVVNADLRLINIVIDNAKVINNKLSKKKAEPIDTTNLKKLVELRERLAKHGVTDDMLTEILFREYTPRDIRADLYAMSDTMREAYVRGTIKPVRKDVGLSPKKKSKANAARKKEAKKTDEKAVSMAVTTNSNKKSTPKKKAVRKTATKKGNDYVASA